MKIAIGQINTTIGDFGGNLEKIVSFSDMAAGKGADLIVFPEMAITGYPPLDFLENESFINKSEEFANKASIISKKIDIIFGFISRSRKISGKRIFNSAAFCRNGKIKKTIGKTLLPTYDVFDEGRYFEPAESNEPIRIGDFISGITICEDIWNDKDVWKRLPYKKDPIGELAGKGADLLINISASPFTVEKFGQRLAILRRIARKRGMPIVYANLVGGNDNLIFDGRSMIMNGKGELAGLCRPFEEDLAVFETSGMDFTGTAISMESTMDDTAEIASALSLGLKDYVKKTGFEKVLIGLSGGIDSAVTAAIAAAALGPRNVISVMMPSRYSSVMSVRDSLKIAENLGVRHFAIPIDPIFDAFRDSLAPILGGDDEGVVFENVQARIRGVLLMALSNRLGALVINTGNKSELAAGYCTLYGDMIGGIGVLADLTKENVYALARHFNREREIIPETAITRPPSAELRPDQKDEDTIPPYPVLDNIVKLYIEDQADLDGIEARGYDRETAAKIIKMIMTSEYKRRQAPMGLKITAKAFGTGRRIPIAHRFMEE